MITSRQAWQYIIANMEKDNGVGFEDAITTEREEKGMELVRQLQADGFFNDNPDDPDGSFWQAAAGEIEERELYFRKLPAYYELNALLDEIFNETPTFGVGND